MGTTRRIGKWCGVALIGVLALIVVLLLAIQTPPGKAMLAVVQNPDAARLMGIDVKRAVALSYALSTALAGQSSKGRVQPIRRAAVLDF